MRECKNCGATKNTKRRQHIGYGEVIETTPYRIDKHGYCQYCKRYKPTFAPIIYR